MARPPRIRVPIHERLPRLTEGGKLLSDKEIGGNIDNWIASIFADELRMTAFLDVNTRRQIRLATGIGNMEAYVEQFNKGFADTSQLYTDKSKAGKEAFGEAWTNRPRLKKISIEGRIVFVPRQKQ